MRKHTEKLSALAPPSPRNRAGLARTHAMHRAGIISGPPLSAMRGPAYLAVKAVGSFVPKLTKKAFEKHGFSTATLLTDWSRIVGEDLGRDTRPERLKWPRVSTDADTPQASATLVLRVDPARALDISYKERQIIERINTYFGYRAIAELRIVQAPVEMGETRPKPATREPDVGTPQSSTVSSDDPLSQALARLEARVVTRRP